MSLQDNIKTVIKGLCLYYYLRFCFEPTDLGPQSPGSVKTLYMKDWRSENMKRIGRVFVLAMVFCLAVGGALFANGTAEAKTAKKQLTIGFNPVNTTMTWMQFARDALLAKAKELGVAVIVTDTENSVAKQSANMEDLIARGVDGIITDPIDVTSLIPAINKAVAAGIPVATLDRAATGSNYSFFVGSDDVGGGRLIADFVNQKLSGNGNIVLLTGSLGSSPQLDRSKGFKDELAKFPGLHIVFEQTGEFFREKGMKVMEDAITAVPKFDAVVCQNDDMMMGAIQALKAAGIDRKSYVITGYDGIPDGLTAIRDGLADCTVQYPVGQAPEVLTRLVNSLRGNPPKEKDYKMMPWVITKDNLSTGDFYSLVKK
jgi:ribose transport system substrate-binding protein